MPGRPPWWPQDAAWPPRGGPQRWSAGRSRFFRRAAAAAGIVLILGACGAVSILWIAATALGIVAPGSGAPALILAGVLVAMGLAALTLASVIRRVALPIGGVMEAADRVADGDYDVRLAETGSGPLRALARSFNAMTARLASHDRLRRDLMADVAHELRTPLTVIQGKLEGLIDGVYSPDAEQLHQLLEETHVLSRLVEDLRTLALSEGGGLKLEREPTDLAALARDAVALFEKEARERDVTLGVDATADVPPIEIDALRIREVLTNLLSNALRHTPAGGSVRVHVAPSARVEVRDTGSGMTPDAAARAFYRFFKCTGSHGSGLGLAIAKALVEAHGGEIRASSEPGRGTTITFSLPPLQTS
jgi:signal transduction histidine kinase